MVYNTLKDFAISYVRNIERLNEVPTFDSHFIKLSSLSNKLLKKERQVCYYYFNILNDLNEPDNSSSSERLKVRKVNSRITLNFCHDVGNVSKYIKKFKHLTELYNYLRENINTNQKPNRHYCSFIIRKKIPLNNKNLLMLEDILNFYEKNKAYLFLLSYFSDSRFNIELEKVFNCLKNIKFENIEVTGEKKEKIREIHNLIAVLNDDYFSFKCIPVEVINSSSSINIRFSDFDKTISKKDFINYQRRKYLKIDPFIQFFGFLLKTDKINELKILLQKKIIETMNIDIA